MDFPVTRIAEPRTIRLVASARLRDPVLLKLVSAQSELNALDARLEDLAEIESATSGRLQAQKRGTDHINPQELVAAVPHAHFINAAFSYWRPKNLNRFNGPGRGAWYAALCLKTCLAEAIFHLSKELEYVNDFNTSVNYTEMWASFAGEFVDLRNEKNRPLCLHEEPSIGYPAGNLLSESTRSAGYNGIIYPSVRHKEGTCIVALQPKAVQSVVQGRIVSIVWSGNREPLVKKR